MTSVNKVLIPKGKVNIETGKGDIYSNKIYIHFLHLNAKNGTLNILIDY
jgi:hypothetical protein